MKKSFTLIELLVVIAIIGILAAIIIANMSSARARARDARRKSDLDTIRTAIEMCLDANPAGPPGTGDTTYQSNAANWTTLQTAIAGCTTPSVLTTLPTDPQNGQAVGGVVRKIYRYRWGTTDSLYELDAFLENDTNAMINDGGNANATPTWRYELGPRLTVLAAL